MTNGLGSSSDCYTVQGLPDALIELLNVPIEMQEAREEEVLASILVSRIEHKRYNENNFYAYCV